MLYGNDYFVGGVLCGGMSVRRPLWGVDRGREKCKKLSRKLGQLVFERPRPCVDFAAGVARGWSDDISTISTAIEPGMVFDKVPERCTGMSAIQMIATTGSYFWPDRWVVAAHNSLTGILARRAIQIDHDETGNRAGDYAYVRVGIAPKGGFELGGEFAAAKTTLNLPRAAATRFTAGAEPVHDAVQQDYREAALLVIQRCFEGYGTTRSRLGVVGHYWIGIMHLPRCPSANAPGKSDLQPWPRQRGPISL